MSWQLGLGGFAVVLITVMMLAVYFVGRDELYRKPTARAEIARSWLTAFAGPLAIIAAIIAAFPVFKQLEDSRAGALAVRIDVTQKYLDDLNFEYEKLVRGASFVGQYELIFQPPISPPQNSVAEFCRSPQRSDLLLSMQTKSAAALDYPAKLSSDRKTIKLALDALAKELDYYCNKGPGNMLKVYEDMTGFKTSVESYKHPYESFTRDRETFLNGLRDQLLQQQL